MCIFISLTHFLISDLSNTRVASCHSEYESFYSSTERIVYVRIHLFLKFYIYEFWVKILHIYCSLETSYHIKKSVNYCFVTHGESYNFHYLFWFAYRCYSTDKDHNNMLSFIFSLVSLGASRRNKSYEDSHNSKTKKRDKLPKIDDYKFINYFGAVFRLIIRTALQTI